MGLTNRQQLGQWFAAYGGGLTLYARQLVDETAAEDIVQAVFLKLLGEARQVQDPRAWLYRSVRNAVLNAARNRRTAVRHQRTLRTGGSAWFTRRDDDRLDAEVAQRALEAIDAPLREIVVLRLWSGMTLEEISQLTGQPVSTLFSRYKIALQALRERMHLPCTSACPKI